jgi:hypothetical protein
MIYLGIKYHLRTHLPKPTTSFIWKTSDNEALFKYLHTKFSAEDLEKSRNRLEIKQAFIDYFEPIGYILFKLKHDQVLLKVFPYKIDPVNSTHLNELTSLISDNLTLIDFEYKDNKNQIMIKGKLRRNIFLFVDQIDDEHINKKDFIKYAIKHVLKLDEHDLIFVKKRQVFIKKFQATEKSEKEHSQAISSNELELLYKEYFDEETKDELIYTISQKVFQNLFIDRHVNNAFFEANVYQVLQEIILQELVEFPHKSSDLKESFSTFIIKNNILPIFKLLSEQLLSKLASKNPHVTQFIKYYSGNLFVEDGKQYKSPALLSQDGTKWNPALMQTLITNWFGIKTKMDTFKIHLFDINNAMNNLYDNENSPEKLQKKQTDLQNEINTKQAKLNLLNDKDSTNIEIESLSDDLTNSRA